jgi:hypothetical protein
MPVSFTTCPFEVVAGDKAGIVIEDRKTGQSWQLSNQRKRKPTHTRIWRSRRSR